MKQYLNIVIITISIVILFSTVNNFKVHSKNKNRKKGDIKNKFTSYIKGCLETLIPESARKDLKIATCTNEQWKRDTSIDVADQAENIILMFQLFDNYKQYLVPEIDKVCQVDLLVKTFFDESWKKMKNVRTDLKLLKKASTGENIFEKLGGFAHNTAYANLRLNEQEVYNIFNAISRGPVMSNIKESKVAINLREIIINSFNAMSVLSKILNSLFKKYLDSQLFRREIVSMECFSTELKKESQERDKLTSIIRVFSDKTKILKDHEASVKLFSEIVCQRESLLKIITEFNKVESAKGESEILFIIGKVTGLLIKLIGTKHIVEK